MPAKHKSKLNKILRNTFLVTLVIFVISGLFAADHYIQNRPSIQAKRFLEQNAVPLDPASAVEAARSSRLFVLEQLSLAGVDLGMAAPDGLTPLLAAIEKEADESTQFLLQHPSVIETLDTQIPNQFHRALSIALEKRNFELSTQLIKLGANPNVYLGQHRPLLVEAARTEDDELLNFLLDADADPNVVGVEGFPPIVWAIEAQNGYQIHRLLNAGATVNISGLTGQTLLIEAISLGEIDLVNTLLAAGATPEPINETSKAPINIAIQNGDFRMLEVILTSGIDLQQPDATGRLPIDLAIARQDTALLKMILDNGAPIKPDTFETAFKNRDVTTTSLLAAHRATIDTSPEKITDLLRDALNSGSLELSRTMVELGGNTQGTLWSAIQTRRNDIIQFALENGACITETNEQGQTPLAFALSTGYTELAHQLLKRGASPNLKNAEAEPWVAAAIRNGKLECAEMLLEYGADLTDTMCSDGHSLLEWALARKASGIVKRLLNAKADPNRRVQSPASKPFRAQFKGKTFNWHLGADSQLTPLMLAAELNDIESAKALVEAGASTSHHSKRYLWPVNIAAWNSNIPMQRIMLKRDPHKIERKLVIDLSEQKARLFENDTITFTTRVSTGKKGYSTPRGTYVISDKHRHHTSTLYDSSMPYFQRFSCAAFGIHEGYVPNYPASHGCIRLPSHSARHLFEVCQTGDVMIVQQ